jgi:hypothetical protein
MHRPGETVTGGSIKQDVLLHVVEVFHRQAQLGFAKRRLSAPFAESFERPQIVFGPGDQRDVAERVAANGVKDIAQHRAVDPAILGLGCLA